MIKMPIRSNADKFTDIPLGLSMAMAQNPSVLPMFERLDNKEIRSLAGLDSAGNTDMFHFKLSAYPAADSFGRTRMF